MISSSCLSNYNSEPRLAVRHFLLSTHSTFPELFLECCLPSNCFLSCAIVLLELASLSPSRSALLLSSFSSSRACYLMLIYCDNWSESTLISFYWRSTLMER